MFITVNGVSVSYSQETVTKQDILHHYSSSPAVVVELNTTILAKQQYSKRLKDGDVVEIVAFVGGG